MKRRVWNLLHPSPRRLGVLLSLLGACSGGDVGDPVAGNFGGGPAFGVAGTSGVVATPGSMTTPVVGAAGAGSVDPQTPGSTNGIVPTASGACGDARVE